MAQKAEQRRRFKAVLCTKPHDFDTIRDERRQAEKEGRAIIFPAAFDDGDQEEEGRTLDGFFLVKHHL